MRLNVGAGSKRLEGYVGVDAVARAAADIVAPATAIPLDDGVAEEVMAIHLFEHFYRWECDAALLEWKRLLAPGGRLVLELPDLIKCCRNVLDGGVPGGKEPDQLTLWGLYGDPRQSDPFMAHRWGWTAPALAALLKQHGFVDIKEEAPQFHPAGKVNRDMRIVARKP